eukprot:TRINITY_DN1143_c0_g1_i2.p1 TRINITY_DN1143_c0_g1~~TRINITY_DN1143_c0_g1_i2.p1  ORF type:complete len:561 (+),score=188.87 TRINITY_DN1143_c0_g1_i2:96-1778(+)
MSRKISAEELAKHNTGEDCWIAINGTVYDVTKFLGEHPGGKKVVLTVAGKDGTAKFESLHNAKEVLAKYGSKLTVIGFLESIDAATSAPKALAGIPTQEAPTKVKSGVVVSTNHSAPAEEPKKARRAPKYVPREDAFGDLIPFSDPLWYQEWNSPYFKETHRKFRAAVREFVDKEIIPFCFEWDEAKHIPASVRIKCAQAGILPAALGAPWRTDLYGEKIAGGVLPEEFDQFHVLIMIDELARTGSTGVVWGIIGGLGIGLPPVMHFGSEELVQRVAIPCLRGEKTICLNITEPYAGSDVAGIQCEAVKTADGKHYIVNGEKKWITNGTFADFFTVAVRTGGPGHKGISLLLIERTMPGVTTKQMNCMGVWASGTAYVTFEDVKVPVENLLGSEGDGFRLIMFNFIAERFGMIVQAQRFARCCLEDSFKYAHKRKAFGQRLIDNAVVRLKIANMARRVEASQAFLEYTTHQLNTMNVEEIIRNVAGPVALLKAQGSDTLEFCAREAAQIFGGLSYTRGGQGERIERIYREVRAQAIPGGSEEIMLELGVRMAMRNAKSRL